MKTFIIAEAGVNHNGSFELAKKMVDAAKKSGVDCIKFQTFIPEKLVTTQAEMADYQVENVGKKTSQVEMLKKLALTYDEFRGLKKYCDDSGIMFLSTPFDIESIDFLEEIGQKLWKIPSGEITNYPYLKRIGITKNPVILSTGMSTLKEVEQAVDVLRQFGSDDIILLHCTTEYPAPFEDVNFNAMISMHHHFNIPIGYSDHTKGILAPIVAVSMGAVVIEKHFTLDKNMKGPDHRASIDTNELTEMVSQIRTVESMLSGSGAKSPVASEEKNKNIARKSIVAACKIKKGECFSESNLATKRPGDGISPMEWEKIIGKVAKKSYDFDELIDENEI